MFNYFVPFFSSMIPEWLTGEWFHCDRVAGCSVLGQPVYLTHYSIFRIFISKTMEWISNNEELEDFSIVDTQEFREREWYISGTDHGVSFTVYRIWNNQHGGRKETPYNE